MNRSLAIAAVILSGLLRFGLETWIGQMIFNSLIANHYQIPQLGYFQTMGIIIGGVLVFSKPSTTQKGLQEYFNKKIEAFEQINK